MIKRKSLMTRAAMFLVTAFVLFAFTLPVTAAPVTATTTVPAGQTSFSIDLRVNEATAYAGIEFALRISNESAVTFASFTPKLSGAAASPFQTESGLHYFGFMAASNTFSSGDTLAGTLNFTGYTGSQALTLTVEQMKVVRLVDSKSETTENESPAYVFTIQRDGAAATNYTVTFDTAGGTRTGGGELVQTVPAGGAAVAPIVNRGDYTFDGWDKSFDNVTADITVTAKWTSGGSGAGSDSTGTGGNGGSGGGGSGGGGGGLSTGGNTDVGTTTDPSGPLTGAFHYFDDVDETHYSWALEAVDALAEAGVVNGTSDRIYSPALSIKRGDFTLMLVRAYTINDAFTENFSDVPAGSYYHDAIGSAKVRGVAMGYEDGTFRPDNPITRQDMMVLIDRTMQVIGKPLPRGSESDLSIFADRGNISDYARESVMALVKSGIIQGDGTNVNPLGNTTRAEMAVALYRLLGATS